jgi:hypothetical protein
MSFPLHQRLLHEATQHGTDEVLRLMPAPYSPELEQAIRLGVRQAVLYYVVGVDTLSQRLQPLDQRRTVRA